MQGIPNLFLSKKLILFIVVVVVVVFIFAPLALLFLFFSVYLFPVLHCLWCQLHLAALRRLFRANTLPLNDNKSSERCRTKVKIVEGEAAVARVYRARKGVGVMRHIERLLELRKQLSQ